MDKKKTSKKRKPSYPKIMHIKDMSKFREIDPEAEILDKTNLANVLKECIVEGDAKSAMEAVLTYIRVSNRKKLAETTHISRSTIEHILQHGNPTAEVLFKLLCA